MADLPHEVSRSVLEIAGCEIPVVQLSDGRRIITAEGLVNFIRFLTGGDGPEEIEDFIAVLENQGIPLPAEVLAILRRA